MSGTDLARRLSTLYERRSLQEYVRWKVKTDPLYGAVLEQLRNDERPLIDVGCGVGILAFYLREQGYAAPIRGLDFDPRKIEVARKAALHYRSVEFSVGDARDPLPPDHHVVLLDVLQYFDEDSQQRILGNAARAVPPGGRVIVRQTVRDRSWRFRLTKGVDAFARAVRWLRAERLEFPKRETILAPFPTFSTDIRPLWGRTPFNNYLFVFTRPGVVRLPE